MEHPIYTVFRGESLLTRGSLADVTLAAKTVLDARSNDPVLAFDDATGQQVDLDLRGTRQGIAKRLAAAEVAVEPNHPRLPGRPKLGVVAREITLLPRHWEWLAAQPGGASVSIRKLVEAARHADGGRTRIRQAQEAADRFMSALLGNQAGYEEASRALYAGEARKFAKIIAGWPKDLREYVRKLAEGAFAAA